MIRRLVCALFALALTSCDVNGRVLFVGDSNVALNADVFTGYLYAGHQQGTSTWTQPAPAYLPTFAAASGGKFAHTSGNYDWLGSLASVGNAHTYDAVVLAMGLNDAATGACTQNVQTPMGAVIAALPASIPVIIVNVPNVPSTAYDDTCIGIVNAWLAAAAGTDARFHLISADAVLSALASNARYESDGIHYTDAAAVALAEAIVTVLDGL